MKKKGFTLIELIAVIAIIAVIALITVPIIGNITKDMRKKSFTHNANGIVESAKIYYSSKSKELDFDGEVFGFGSSINSSVLDGSKLNIKGKKPVAGKIEINQDGEIKMNITDGKYCASKDFSSSEINVVEGTECAGISEFPILSAVADVKTDTISVIADCKYESEKDPDIVKYEFSKDNGKTWNSHVVKGEYLNYYIYSGLKQEDQKQYNIIVKATTKTGIVVEKTVTPILSDLGSIKVEVPEGWAQSKQVTVTYPEGRYEYFYKIDDGEWKNVTTTGSNKFLTDPITKEGETNLYVKVEDKTGNFVSSTAYVVANIDHTNPTIDNITNSSGGNWTASAVTLSTKAYSTSPIEKFEYSTDNSTWKTNWTNGAVNLTNKTVSDVWDLNYEKTVYIRACTVVGLCSDSKSTPVRIDKNKPVIANLSNSSSGNWTNQNVTIGTSVSSIGSSGLARFEYSYNNSSWASNWSSGAVNLTNKTVSDTWTDNDANKTVYIRACNNAGLCGDSKSTALKIDKSAPNTPSSTIRYGNSSGSVRTNANSWSNQNLWWGSFSATDNGSSNINRYEYSTNCTGSVNGTLSSSYTYQNGTNYTFCIRSVDNAGNPSGWSGSYYFKVDTTKPVITNLSNSSGGSWTKSNVTVGTNVTTIGSSGLQKFEYSYDNSSWVSNNWSSGAVNLTNKTVSDTWKSEINKTVYIRACNNAGTCSDSKSTNIKIDKTPPTMTFLPVDGTYKPNAVIATVSCSDGGSGMYETRLTDGTCVSTNLGSYNSSTGVKTNCTGFTVTGDPSTPSYTAQYVTSVRTNKASYGYCRDNAGNETSITRTYTVASSSSNYTNSSTSYCGVNSCTCNCGCACSANNPTFACRSACGL